MCDIVRDITQALQFSGMRSTDVGGVFLGKGLVVSTNQTSAFRKKSDVVKKWKPIFIKSENLWKEVDLLRLYSENEQFGVTSSLLKKGLRFKKKDGKQYLLPYSTDVEWFEKIDTLYSLVERTNSSVSGECNIADSQYYVLQMLKAITSSHCRVLFGGSAISIAPEGSRCCVSIPAIVRGATSVRVPVLSMINTLMMFYTENVTCSVLYHPTRSGKQVLMFSDSTIQIVIDVT